MPTAFADVRFPEDISYGSKGGPGFSTEVYTATSGAEQRNRNWQFARCKYDVSHGIRDKDDMDIILNFFYVMGGKATGFRYKDWSDYQLARGQIGVGNAVKTEFQITKTYTAGALSYTRNLLKIVSPVAGPPAVVFEVYVDDVLLSTGYTVDYSTGVVTFDTAPTSGQVIEVTCEFDVPVRFDTDEMDITLEAWQLETWDDIPLVEIKPQ